MTLMVRTPPGCEAERRYAIDVVMGELLGLQYEIVTVDDGAPFVRIADAADPDGGEVRVADDLFARMDSDWSDRQWLPSAGQLERWHVAADLQDAVTAASVPVLYGKPGLSREAGTTTLGLDVFASAFVMLTRYEEAVVALSVKDAHDRFPAWASAAAQDAFLDRPLVDEYVEILWTALRARGPRLTRRPRTYELWLSHDVDIPRSTGRGVVDLGKWVAADVIRRREPGLAARRARAYPAARKG